jgi:tetratricopeptide (TPR) repeat protein
LDSHVVTPLPATGRAEGGQVQQAQPDWAASAPPLAAGYVPRPETAAQALDAALLPGSTTVLVPDRPGTGGRSWRDACGKTQLAVAAARSLSLGAAVELVIWLTATSRASVLSGYAEAAARAGVVTGGDPESVAARFIAWLRDTDRPWLVVFDDLTADVDLDKRLWPSGANGRVLITTANPAAVAGRPARLVPVGPFSRREALGYLLGRLTADLDQRQGAIDLVAELGNEPLALAQASAVIASSELTCHDYREHFLRRRDQAVTTTGGHEAASAAISWMLSMDHADLLSPGTAQSVLVLAALLDGNGIPGSILATAAARRYCAAAAEGGSSQAVEDGLGALESAGLLSVDPERTPPLVRMSWPVQAAVRAAMPDAMLAGAARAAADAVLEAWPATDTEDGLSRGLRSCADSLRGAAGRVLWEEDCHPVLLRAGRSLDAARLTGPAVSYWRDLAAAAGQFLGQDHPAVFEINERLARAYLAAGRAAEAIALLQWVRRVRAARLGPDHPDTLEITRSLGLALVSAGRFGEAIAVLGEAAAGYQRSSGANGLPALSAREDLAAAHRAAGEFSAAIAVYRATLADRERLQDPRHADTIAVRQKLGEAYLADGQAKAAIGQYERAVSDRERVLGQEHLLTIAARGALGSAYHAAGKMASAVRLAERTRAEYATALGPDHPDTLAACVNLAHAYYGVGRITDATRLLKQTIDRAEQSLPAFDPLIVAARSSLANISGTGA